ncbi:hypothetical protein BDV59DRAFT_202387 [Aspergillus ambiguus]|uniref:uncharacterized protein n=1 Tax=Aspergillus ambiguus TaxID=176160 RepID=UPI003CCDB85C
MPTLTPTPMHLPVHLSRVCLALTARASATPFLYQTRTLARALATDASPDEQAPAPAPTKPRMSYLHRRAAAVARHRRPSPSPTPRPPTRRSAPTMTQGEKQVFGELLEQIGVVPGGADAPSRPAESSADTTADGDAERSEMAQISAIFDSVLRDVKTRTARPGRPAVPRSAGETADGEDARDAIRWAGEYTDEAIAAGLREERLSTARGIEIVVQREAGKIEAALRAAVDDDGAGGDTGIWEVCKGRIFSMLEYLEAGAEGPRAGKEDDSGLRVPEGVPAEPVVVALYPQMLLVAFRLLNLHFPGSPLIGQFRATIKAHGRASAVLGGSTGLYNELIYFAWRGGHDLPGVVALLQEMEVTGVEADARTAALLNGIARQRERDLREHRRRGHVEGRGGAALREPWWDLAPNRRAVRALFGPEGWMERLERRGRERERRERVPR